MTVFSEMVIAGLYAALVQNLVLNSVFGISEAIRIAKRPKHFFMHGVAIMFFCLSTSVVCYLLRKINFIGDLDNIYLFFMSCIVLIIIYLASGTLMIKVFHANKKFMNSLGFCAFNSLVLSIPTIDIKADYNFFEVVGNSIGAGFAFVVAILLINAGMKHISTNKNIPKAFAGTPIILIYVAILTLAISCLSTDVLFYQMGL